MGKWKAFLIHLLLSASVCGALLLVFIKLWYPMPYFTADGGWQGLRLITAVELVLGPLLTLIVYKGTKTRRALVFDYSVIGLLQLTVLGFGIWTVYETRTALIVFADGSFYTVDPQTARQMGPDTVKLIARSEESPASAYVRMPADAESRQHMRKEALATRRPLFLRRDLLEPLGPEGISEVEGYEPSISHAMEKDPDYLRQRDRFLNGRPAGNYVFVPLLCRYDRLVIVLDRRSGRVVDWLPIHLKYA